MDTEAPKAWIVPVWTKRLGGGESMLVCYVAGFADAAAAKKAVREHLGSYEGDDVRDPAPVSNSTADALQVRPGLIWML